MAIFNTVEDIKFKSAFTGAKVLNDALQLRLVLVDYLPDVPYWSPVIEFKHFSDIIDVDSLMQFAIAADNLLDAIAPQFVNLSLHTTGSDFTMYSAWSEVPRWASADAIFNHLGITRIKATAAGFGYALNAQWLFDYLSVLDQMTFALAEMYSTIDNLDLYPTKKSGTGTTWTQAENNYLAATPEYNPPFILGYYAYSAPGVFFKQSSTSQNDVELTIPAVAGASTILRYMAVAGKYLDYYDFVPSPNIPQTGKIYTLHSDTIDESGDVLTGFKIFPDDEFDSMPSPPTTTHGLQVYRYDAYFGLDGTDWPQLTGA
jgi:hypothetical protein